MIDPRRQGLRGDKRALNAFCRMQRQRIAEHLSAVEARVQRTRAAHRRAALIGAIEPGEVFHVERRGAA